MKLKVAAIQMTRTGNKDGNLTNALKQIRIASGKGALIICLPELFYSPSKLQDRKKGKVDYSKVTRALMNIARELKIYVIAGLIEPANNRKYNSAFVFSPKGKIVGKYRKMHLFPSKPIKETDIFLQGKTNGVFNTEFCRIGIIICYDLRFPVEARKLAKNGAEILFIPAGWPVERIDHWKTLAKARGIENQYYVVGVNRCGSDDARNMGGNSLISDFRGEVLCSAGQKKEEVIIGEIDLAALRKHRKQFPFLKE